MDVNFHMLVAVATVVFFFVLRRYKHNVESKNKNKSGMTTVLFVPALLYAAYYMFFPSVPSSQNIVTPAMQAAQMSAQVSSGTTDPFPDSTLSMSV